MSTWTTRDGDISDAIGSQIELVNLGNHLHDARPDELALLAQGHDVRGRARGFTETRLGAIQLAFQPRDFVERLGPIRAQRVDHADELANFFFETINGLEI